MAALTDFDFRVGASTVEIHYEIKRYTIVDKMNERNRQLPCHEFKQTTGGVVDFEIISYDQMSATSRSMSLTDQPHRHTFYEILYYTAGEGTHFIDFTAYPFRPPVLYFISPGQVHFWDRMETGRGYVLLFTENFLLNAEPERNLFNELAFYSHFPGLACSRIIDRLRHHGYKAINRQ